MNEFFSATFEFTDGEREHTIVTLDQMLFALRHKEELGILNQVFRNMSEVTPTN